MPRNKNLSSKNVITGVILVFIVAYVINQPSPTNQPDTPREQPVELTNRGAGIEAIEQAFQNRQGDLQVQAQGKVERVLSDDNKGSRHQRFIIRLTDTQTLLVAHNIDLAPRINNLKPGDVVEFYGEYEWNAKGGVIHWTHHDPHKRHVDGWLKHKGKIYQ
ncbi:DUF3465 domain-containing protein [Thalassotalea sp. PS06]|uniref:DUF3465 domain-containing protein n=1 Tax=Thalassotalea sp. PS06 TaxID=2594005 RepID=UPI00116580F3|nr:DUF3465 domain-containing protein [Thalassotalea sp. PS06]QDP00353.1 DUF3465 domain-containing protein [Thalassotalea sp. PS06]